MKIALLSEKYTPDIGGLAISTGRMGHLLASAGHDVYASAPSPSLFPTIKQTHRSNGVTVTRFGPHKRMDDTLVDWFELIAEEHKREPFDLIHAYFLTQAGFVAAYAGKYLGIPSIVSIRGNDIERAMFDPAKFSHSMYALQHASAVTTNAGELAKKAKAFFEREIILIPNGIDTALFKKAERNEVLAEALGIPTHVTLSDSEGSLPLKHQTLRSQQTLPQSDKLPVIGFVGELREKKGLQTFLAGYALLNKTHPSTLLIVGEVRAGEDKKTFEEFQLANPDARMIVTGHVPHKDLPAYYALMDIFAHLSLRDGMPNAVLEAMACELPVIATPVGGILDVADDGINMRTVPVNDVNAFVNTAIDLLENKKSMEQIGMAARRTVMEKFTVEKELRANLNLYKALNT